MVAACAQSAKPEAIETGDVAALEGKPITPGALADVTIHLLDTKSQQRVETARRVYRLSAGGEALFATAADREPLIVQLEAGRAHRLRLEARACEPSEEISVRLAADEGSRTVSVPIEPYTEPHATLAVTVRTADGSPVDTARVELRAVGERDGPTHSRLVQSGERASLDLPGDRYWCRVSAVDTPAPWPSQRFELLIPGGDALIRDVTVQPGGTVRVRLPRGHRKLHVRLDVSTVPNRATYAMYERRGVPEDWRGRFRTIRDTLRTATLAPGSYTIGVAASTGGPRWRRDVTVEAGKSVDLDFSDDLRDYLENLRRDLARPAR